MIMKRGIVSTGILALLIGATSQAQATRLGIHGVFSNGGDVEDSELGFGGQLELPINPILSVELAVTQFGDEVEGDGVTLEQDLTSVGLSAVFRGPIGPYVDGYMLFGANYNTIDTDISIQDPAIASLINTNMELDDEIGFHIGAGFNFAIAYNMEFFAEYRYTFLETEGEAEVSNMYETLTTGGDYEYDFGVAKIGLNFLF
ncbi:MAG: porin family protein [Candidatus Electrothrix sp. ATG1]|nr:porin family protein [Candidatus Electrothrix sp. ATG1]